MLLINEFAKANIPFIEFLEIGYLKTGYDVSLLNYSPYYIEKASLLTKGSVKLSAMIHPKDFCNHKKWSTEVLSKLSLIRICINDKNILETKLIIEYFHKLGLEVSLNLTHVSKYTPEKCAELGIQAEDMGADYFYIADSNGCLFPKNTRKYTYMIRSQVKTLKIGFHAHDNLGLAQINAITAAEEGVDILDSSLMGYGKGAGNLRTELFPIAYIKKTRSGLYNDFLDSYYSLYNLVKFFNNNVELCDFKEKYRFSLYGVYDINLEIDNEIRKIAEKMSTDEITVALNYIYSNKDVCPPKTRLDKIRRLL